MQGVAHCPWTVMFCVCLVVCVLSLFQRVFKEECNVIYCLQIKLVSILLFSIFILIYIMQYHEYEYLNLWSIYNCYLFFQVPG